MRASELEQQHLEMLKAIVTRSLANTPARAFIFGSWANGTARGTSDIDIGVIGLRDIDSHTLDNLREELLESDIPYFTEVVDFSKVSDDFKKIALSSTIELVDNRNIGATD